MIASGLDNTQPLLSEDASSFQPIRRTEARVLYYQSGHRNGKPWNDQSEMIPEW